MLAPKRVRHRKVQKGRNKGKAHRGNKPAFGQFALQAVARGFLSNQQIESGRVAITRHVKRGGKVFIRVFPDKPFTRKPAETRMGKGKGTPEGWICPIKPGRIIYELDGVSEEVAKEALRLAGNKLPFATRVLERV